MQNKPENPIVLAIDLSSNEASLSLHSLIADHPPVLVKELLLESGFKHSEKLLLSLQLLLDQAGVGLEEVARWVLPVGPGSFTGLRMGLSVAKAFSLTQGKPLDLLSASEARALGWRASQGQKPDALWVLTHCTSQSFVASRWVAGKGVISEEVVEKLQVFDKETVLTDKRVDLTNVTDKNGQPVDGAIVFGLKSRHLAECFESAQSRTTHQSVRSLAEANPLYHGSSRFQ